MIGNALRPLFRLPPRQTFQFTPLHERQHIAWKRLWIQKHIFQFTPLHERQHYRAAMDRESAPYFNSRLYMRGSCRQAFAVKRCSISIHASTWEAAFWVHLRAAFVKISIHASTWEAAAKIHNFFNKIDTIFYQTLFFYSNFSEGSPFFNSSSIFLINCIFLPAPMSHKKMYESHQRTHF